MRVARFGYRKPFVYAIVGVLCIATMASCGIDTIAYLSEMPTVQSRDESALVFKGPSIADDNYYGVFIFYKIYASDAAASSDLNALESRQNADNAVPGSNVESFLVSTSGLDYQQAVLTNNLSIPTLDKEIIDSNLASITFASASNVEPTLTVDNVPLELRRSSLSSSGTYLSFLDEPQAGNIDYKSSESDVDENIYYIQFFAASYGLDLSDLSELYGDAVYLGRITQYFLN